MIYLEVQGREYINRSHMENMKGVLKAMIQRLFRKWGRRTQRVAQDMGELLEMLEALPEETGDEKRDRALVFLKKDLREIQKEFSWFADKTQELETHPLMCKQYEKIDKEVGDGG